MKTSFYTKKIFFILPFVLFPLTYSSNSVFAATTQTVADRVAGRIVLAVEAHGEAWYIDPITKERWYLRDGSTAFEFMRRVGLGVSEQDYNRLLLKNYSLWNRLKGRVILRVQAHGEAYYLDPIKKELVYLKDGNSAYDLLRKNSLGISTNDLSLINVSIGSTEPTVSPTLNISEVNLANYWLNIINTRRQANGLTVLNEDYTLEKTSSVWVKHLAAIQTITHERPNQLSLTDWAIQNGVIFNPNTPPQTHIFSENIGQIPTKTDSLSLQKSLDKLFEMMILDKIGHHYQTIHDPVWNTIGSSFYLTPLPNGQAMLYAVFHYANK